MSSCTCDSAETWGDACEYCKGYPETCRGCPWRFSLHDSVRAFHRKFGHPVRTIPAVPPDEEIRSRLRLISEEFLELLEACGICEGGARVILHDAIEHAPISVDLPELADAMADLAYVIEGTAAVTGIDMAPILEDVHRANLGKEPNPAGVLAKPIKPEGWRGPDSRGQLERQGWDPMQAKDVNDLEVLRVIAELMRIEWRKRPSEDEYLWTCTRDIAARFPAVPEKIMLAKLAALVRRKLIGGCACGCRGDFYLLPAGWGMIGEQGVGDPATDL